MAGIPKLPGFTFSDPTLTKFHLSQTFNLCNGYKLPKNSFNGIGGRELDSNSIKHLPKHDVTRYDPSLTYGRTKSPALPQFTPYYVLYDQKCLTFRAFFKQAVVESPNEFYRVRHVNIIYFLEDDTITVMEPKTPNSGIDQGRLIRRSKIPKNDRGAYWHWKDLNVGKDLSLNGVVYHTVDCDLFTRFDESKEHLHYIWMRALGRDPTAEHLGEKNVICSKHFSPNDVYIQGSRMLLKPNAVPSLFLRKHDEVSTQESSPSSATTSSVHGLPQKFQKDTWRNINSEGNRRQIKRARRDIKTRHNYRFKAVWDDRENQYGVLMKYEILYFLADDTVSVKEVHEKNDGRDPYPVLLRKMKLPKRYTDTPATYAAIYLELSDAEITEFYQPRDFLIGETIFVFGRDILIYDCDKFTRDYFKKALCIEQKPSVDVSSPKVPPPPAQVPPHMGLGSLEDSIQNTITFLPKPPKKDVMRQLLNANKSLRYEMVMDAVHPEDSIRRFLLSYSLADSTCVILEPPIKNSGIIGGKYLRSTLLVKPGSDPLNPDYYGPADFYIGAIITVFQQRFKIVGADLYVYRYMSANSSKFPCEIIESMRNYMFNKGFLKGDVEDQVKDNLESERQWDLDTKGDSRAQIEGEEECLQRLKVGEGQDPEQDKRTLDQIRNEYEESIKHKSKLQPYGVKPVNMECAYPVYIGDMKSTKCTEESAAQYTSYTPKHVDTPEEITAKHYAGVLKDHRAICDGSRTIECREPPTVYPDSCEESQKQAEPKPIMVSPPDLPPQECKIKTVTFVEDPDRCNKNRYDLCELNLEKSHCDCTKYQK